MTDVAAKIHKALNAIAHDYIHVERDGKWVADQGTYQRKWQNATLPLTPSERLKRQIEVLKAIKSYEIKLLAEMQESQERDKI